MTVQETIDVFEKPSDHIKTIQINHMTGIVYSADFVKAFEMAIEALEKQIPKKVIYHDNCGNKTPNQSRCPECYEAINDTWYWTGESWCPYCGQKIQWGE